MSRNSNSISCGLAEWQFPDKASQFAHIPISIELARVCLLYIYVANKLPVTLPGGSSDLVTTGFVFTPIHIYHCVGVPQSLDTPEQQQKRMFVFFELWCRVLRQTTIAAVSELVGDDFALEETPVRCSRYRLWYLPSVAIAIKASVVVSATTALIDAEQL